MNTCKNVDRNQWCITLFTVYILLCHYSILLYYIILFTVCLPCTPSHYSLHFVTRQDFYSIDYRKQVVHFLNAVHALTLRLGNIKVFSHHTIFIHSDMICIQKDIEIPYVNKLYN